MFVSVLLGAANVAIVYFILDGIGVRRRERVILSLVFAFGTIVWYSAAAGSSWHFAHVVATCCMLLAIRACQLDARPALIGLLFGAAVISRLPLLLAAPFFLAYLADRSYRAESGDTTVFGSLLAERPAAWLTRPDWRSASTSAGRSPPASGSRSSGISSTTTSRFGTPFETGYALIPGLLDESQYHDGFFSIVNIPRKLYALFLTGPVEVGEFPWVQPRGLGGLSIFLTTPLFLWSIKARAGPTGSASAPGRRSV